MGHGKIIDKFSMLFSPGVHNLAGRTQAKSNNNACRKKRHLKYSFDVMDV